METPYIYGGVGSGTISCGTVGTTTTCTGTSFGASQTFTATVEFATGGSAASNGVVYSTTQNSTLTLAETKGSLSTTSLTVNAGSATSSATFTGTAATSDFTGTVKFGPYTININVT